MLSMAFITCSLTREACGQQSTHGCYQAREGKCQTQKVHQVGLMGLFLNDYFTAL